MRIFTGYGYGNIFLLSQLLGSYEKAQAFLNKLYSANMPKDAGRPDDYGNGGGGDGYNSNPGGGYGGAQQPQQDNSYAGEGYGRNMNGGSEAAGLEGYGGPNKNYGYRQPPSVPDAPDPN